MSNNVKRKDASTTLNGNTASAATSTSGLKGSSSLSVKEFLQQQIRAKEKQERLTLTLWKRPLKTIEYSTKELIILLTTYGNKVLEHKKIVSLVLISILSLYVLVSSNGPHQNAVQSVYKKLIWCLYWIGLGILSSVGLGTGLHTFLLYLGPHIAQVTLAAYECDALNFPEPPYPDEIICPTRSDGIAVSILSIMAKVRLEAMCWGAGTALGELPPYFMASAARVPSNEVDDPDEYQELQRKQSNREQLSLVDRGKLFLETFIEKVGFMGILACASIPNPLFDLAGITCGHFGVPFWKFFGATLIGKAVIKMHIQKLFVIIAFNETLIIAALSWLEMVPLVGKKLQIPFRSFLDSQKKKLHKGAKGSGAQENGNILASIFEKFVIAMIVYFVVSIINSFAQRYHKRIHKRDSPKVSKD